MHRSSPLQVASAAPALRLVMVLVLMVAALAGVMVPHSMQLALAALGFALVAGPVAVVAEDRRRRAPVPVASVPGTTHAATA